ncbi:MAG: sodium:proton antiporter NhaD [Saprospiraceae bacterium]|nr:sodium:proton antiporter NhaD [Saprospiraceae bacterium]MDW8482885.1 sodium:proton antiporter NhaD [Saprospiraceae bacterium]
MDLLIVVVFIIGYTFIALEHPLKIDKSASALLTGVLCWLVLLFGIEQMPEYKSLSVEERADIYKFLDSSLFEHVGEIAEILFFLIGAMTIVELVDRHEGFRVITDRIKTLNRVRLLWITSIIAFIASSILDNLTTTIIMCALVRRLLKREEDMWVAGGFIVLAANAGGAWSPIGDVTTIMLWIGGQISTFHVIKVVLAPSIICLVVPLLLASLSLKGQVEAPDYLEEQNNYQWAKHEQLLIFILGTLGLLFVPVFKAITHYPPFMGVLLSLGFIWYVTEYIHRDKPADVRSELSVAAVLRRIDTPSVLFFLGILLAVGALASSGHLRLLASTLDRVFEGNIYSLNTLIGMLSAIVDNVPLVAAAMGMYSMDVYPQDHDFWTLLAYCAGTGGSMLVIGSAAGVAAMGLLKMNFIWYLKRISIYALIGYLAGIGAFYLQHLLFTTI